LGRLGSLFKISVKIMNLQHRGLDLRVSLNERGMKAFMIAGKIIQREYIEQQSVSEISYKLLAPEVGRFTLPGFQIELKTDETYSTIYDSNNLQSIIVLPVPN